MINKGFGAPLSTKDGVTVAKEITLKDKFENIGAQLVKEVASRTSDVAGDGTTTAIVLAESIFQQGLKNVSAGANPMAIKIWNRKGCRSSYRRSLEDVAACQQPARDLPNSYNLSEQ